MFPLLVSHGNMIPASQPQIPYCRISCMCVSFLGVGFLARAKRKTPKERPVEHFSVNNKLERLVS